VASIKNPRRLSATPPTARIDGAPVVAENIYLEAGWGRAADGPFEPFDAERDDTDNTADREAGVVVFQLEPARLSGALPEGTLYLTARAIEERPDLVTDEFPNGVDLLSAWAPSTEVAVENPPQAPTAVTALA
jgi:hypothetical protein